MRWFFALLGGLFGLALSAAEHTTDTPEAVKTALAAGKAVIIDVREQTEWDAGHLKDAKSLPLSKIKAGLSDEELKKVLPKDKIIYLHYQSGQRSLSALELLKDKGFDLRALKPGYEKLTAAGLPKADQ